MLATNKTDGNRLFMNQVMQVNADIYIHILCTSPFIKIETIKRGIDAIKDSDQYDSSVLIRKEKYYCWDSNGPLYDINNIPNSIDLPSTLIETMGLYIIKKNAALKTNRRIGVCPYHLEATPLEAIDVNWPEDFELASLIAAGLREKERKLLNNVKTHLTSSMLSDILDDLGLKGVIRGLTLNLPDKKVFGRSKTMRLKVLAKGEDFRGVYKALESYDTIIPNDIIVVENESADFAYFGELNANLAIRAGACAAIIGGKTRDVGAVRGLGFPVFSMGNTCQDVRKRATLDYINKDIAVNGVKIEPECLIFGDEDGVIVIPKSFEKDVLKRAFDVVNNEKSVLLDIASGSSVSQLTSSYGFF
jgi:regulator of RNase E activity RraA